MLVAGDEMGRTQRGNNNAYCIDDDTTWLDWSLREEYGDLLAFTRRLLALRHANPVFRQRRFFEGRPVVPDGRKDVAWFAPTGREMTEEAWHDESLRTLGMFLAGDGIRSRGAHGERIVGESFLLWLHADPDPVEVRLPGGDWAERYEVVLDTSRAEPEADGTAYAAGDSVIVPGRSCLLLRAAP
jgi:glycogen operon protein